MCLVGVLYIVLKVCCCEKEGRKIDNQNKRRSKRYSSESEGSQIEGLCRLV